MTRLGAEWVPDGRAKAIRADCEASLAALDGLVIDLYLLHAPDPRRPWSTSLRGLARLLDEGLVRRVGVANVNRPQLDEALGLAPIAAVQVPVSIFDDRPRRGGLIERCAEAGVAVIAHSPLGGPRRAGRLDGRDELVEAGRSRGATPAEGALAWLLEISPAVVAIPGATRPETARSAARAARLELGPALPPIGGRSRRRSARRAGEVVLVVGIPGAGKSRLAERYVEQGYARLNRDERGGSLRGLAAELDLQLERGLLRAVLDNTYLTRAARSRPIEAAARHGVPVRCVWLDTPLAQAQINMVERLLDRFGALPSPDELRAASRGEPGLLAPTSQMRAVRELEPPSSDEGFVAVERVPFARAPAAGRAAVLVAAAALPAPGAADLLADVDPTVPHLLFDWSPHGDSSSLAAGVRLLSASVSGPVEAALCPHPGGPPSCWCRPPLPGLALAFARAFDVDLGRSILIGAGPAHRQLAAALGAGYRAA
jgi:Aldo/keto reductase family/AAA domain